MLNVRSISIVEFNTIILEYQNQLYIIILISCTFQISSMESQVRYEQKPLTFTYDDYVKRGKTLENLIIDKYIAYNRIGEGSNGQVYKGMDDETKKQVAIKLIDIRSINALKSNAVRAIKQRLCESEPRLMYQFNSRNLIKCYDVYRNDDLKILILEYCNGSTLQRQIDDKRRIPEKQAIQITKHLINGLMELHKHKIIHRDLKAQNIMSHNGTYKIIDFGFSKKLQIAQQNAEIRGTSLGTITTMAPQVMSKRPYGLKADIWSLGVIYFQMIYGVYPYDSLTALSLYQQIKTKKLFQNPNPPKIGGFTPSKQSYEFIKFIIVFETSQRPSWRELVEHPMIKRQNDEVSQRFIQKVDVVIDPTLDDDFETKQSMASNMSIDFDGSDFNVKKIQEQPKREVEQPKKVEKKQQPKPPKTEQNKEKKIQIKQYIKKQQKKEEEKQIQKPKPAESNTRFKLNFAPKQDKKEEKPLDRYKIQNPRVKEQEQDRYNYEKLKQQQKPILNITRGEKPLNLGNVRQLPKEQIIIKIKEQSLEERQQYEFTQRAHLECLKTQFIYRQIVNPLYTTSYLKEDDRATIQFLYLLLARCFNNMSPIQDELEKRHKNKDMIKNLNDQITPLYNQVKAKFLDFSEKLTKTENKYTSLIGDFFKKRIDKTNFSTKDNFLTGIEIINYSKQQQILYTYNYYTSNIQKKIEGVSNLLNVVKRLNRYVQISRITRESLQAKKRDFLTAVKDILS